MEMEVGGEGWAGGRKGEMEGGGRRYEGSEKVYRGMLGRSWVIGSGWFCCVGLVEEFGWE